MSETLITASSALDEARRVMQVCNACRYCEGFCPAFQSMTKRRTFADSDLEYLANLCHNCTACYHACQYAPPHEFAINAPRTLTELRGFTYEAFAWPRGLAALLKENGLVVSLVTAASLAVVVLLVMMLLDRATLFAAQSGAGAFYRIVAHGLMVAVGGAAFGFAVLAIIIGMSRFARAIGLARPTAAEWRSALGAAASSRYLSGSDGVGCNDANEAFTTRRRRYHQLTLWGFVLCFAATSVATVYHYGFGWIAPYPVTSLPVLLGTVGGVMLCAGCAGLWTVKRQMDPVPVAPSRLGMDYAFIALLFLTSATGLVLLALRETPAMGLLLAVHLGFVLAFFLLMPYSKFVHAGYRFVALLKHAQEQEKL